MCRGPVTGCALFVVACGSLEAPRYRGIARLSRVDISCPDMRERGATSEEEGRRPDSSRVPWDRQPAAPGLGQPERARRDHTIRQWHASRDEVIIDRGVRLK